MVVIVSGVSCYWFVTWIILKQTGWNPVSDFATASTAEKGDSSVSSRISTYSCSFCRTSDNSLVRCSRSLSWSWFNASINVWVFISSWRSTSTSSAPGLHKQHCQWLEIPRKPPNTSWNGHNIYTYNTHVDTNMVPVSFFDLQDHCLHITIYISFQHQKTLARILAPRANLYFKLSSDWSVMK